MREQLTYPDWEFEISFEDGVSSLLIIEKPKLYRKYIVELIRQTEGEDGDFVLSNIDDILDIKEHLTVITDPLNVGFSSKKITNKVQQQIKELINSGTHYEQALELLSHLEQFSSLIEADYPLSVTHTPFQISELYKILGIQLQVEYEDELERVMEYMNIMHDICGVSCFVLTQMFSYFSVSELSTLIGEALTLKHNLLFLETREPIEMPKDTRKIIIDQDFCQIF